VAAMIPISTDAPIYHYPIATLVTIALNIFLFVAVCNHAEPSAVAFRAPDGRVFKTEQDLEQEISRFNNDEDAIQEFMDCLIELELGGGWAQFLSVEMGAFKPWQWLTNNFMHAGWLHLIGNMIFLWAFGLIVEGKVGSLVFSLIYLGIGTAYGFLLQLISIAIGWEGHALGASAAIFGLLALCVAWAPANEFTLLWQFGWRFGINDVSILMYGFLFVAKELVFWSVQGFAMSSELLHILGFFVGLPLGLWMVRSGYVDCEGWDLFSYLNGKTGRESKVGRDRIRAREKKAAAKLNAENLEAKLVSKPAELALKLQSQVKQAIDQGEYELAIKIQNRIAASNATVRWNQNDLYRVVQGLLKSREYARAIPLMEVHIESFDEHRFEIQVLLLKIWLHDQRPRKALTYMQGLNPAFLSPEQMQRLKQLASLAKQQISSGVIEIL
jgi:membrane associated rhomboid family serine protease